uniref:ATP-binding protein n=1 Tax=Agathobacter sp. TaxID=2021311 RepID=UPI004055A571
MAVNRRFEALTKICLNNWHYIQQKVIPLSEGINFFTGHSGSGKSTLIDAMQIVLYADTDGRRFFNKAATDDSDRSLIEYLRGMVTIGDDNHFSYLRNQNFSSTIVLELKDTEKNSYQCVGVVFDVETATNDITRMFFWHKSAIPEDCYRMQNRPKSTNEVKKWLTQNFDKENCFYGSHNERFRTQLYDIYLGGLDKDKFPRLFKRAIPFRMNIKLEEFVKEYICMEQNIHIEDMQQSVMEYGRMRKKLEETCQEIERLGEICKQYELVSEEKEKGLRMAYYRDKLDILSKKQRVSDSLEKEKALQAQLEKSKKDISQKDAGIKERRKQRDELIGQIAGSDYEHLRQQLVSLNEWIETLNRSRAKWQVYAESLKEWESVDSVLPQTLWDIEEFQKGTITKEKLIRLKKQLAELKQEVEAEYKDFQDQAHALEKQKKASEQELAQLKQGEKAYPRELEELRKGIQNGLYEETGKMVSVEILADLLDIKNEEWRNAVEGYLGNQKLGIMVEPKYAKLAMDIYEQMDSKKFYRYGVIDTERVMQDKHVVLDHALAEEVEAKKHHVRAYVDFLLGKVVKCHSVEELRTCRIGITSSCVLYHSYRIQHINPAYYTRYAYIGKNSLTRRIHLLQKEIRRLNEKLEPIQSASHKAQQILKLESLESDVEEYVRLQQEMHGITGKEKEKERIKRRLENERYQDAEQLEKKKQALEDLIQAEEKVLRSMEIQKAETERNIESEKKNFLALNEQLLEMQRNFAEQEAQEAAFEVFLSERQHMAYEEMQKECQKEQENIFEKQEEYKAELFELRSAYLKTYPNRSFELTRETNEQYQELYEHLNCENLGEYKKRAAEQAKTAVLHFKDDFIYKIRDAIKGAIQRKDELNRIISKLDFGKDKYQFYIGKNKGADGEYYDMFMDESLEINPSDLDIGLDNQLNLFTMEHEKNYSAKINELVQIFIPPVNATIEEMEEAKRNMDKYADYRTYLRFDMHQIIQNGEDTIKIRLSQMISKNSGGEGQNPLYVALLASFAQAYKIDLRPGLQRNPTLRLVVLDEAFSKMDAEKVASCISLMRGLGFQAIISATNDKIQNYLETVDKVFVFANPNKRAISIQEFERKEFEQLKMDMMED